jgi:beta-glucosidase
MLEWKSMNLKFPENFLWGAAASAHQVEGGNCNDWSEWEKENAGRLAREAKNRWQSWQQERFPEMFRPENYVSGRACGHYSRFREDFDLAKSSGHNAHRFSLEWSRIEPEEGRFNEEEIEHYRQVLLALKERGLEPFVTLWHWTNPLWVRDSGGWENEKTVGHFLRYAKRVFDEYRDLAKFWIPLNEPGTQVSYGYIFGSQPPAVKNKLRANKVLKNLMSAHKEVFRLNRTGAYGYQIGCSHFMFFNKAHKNRPWNILAAKIFDYVADSRFFRIYGDFSDFFGIQYYQPNFINFKIGGRIAGLLENKEPRRWFNDLGWEIFPEGIYRVVKKAAKYGKPIYITENGLPDAEDSHRRKFIEEHLRWLHKAIAEGVDVRGYFHWSLLDNFEMPEVRGFWPRFGLFEMDYRTSERRKRPSADYYASICKNNGLGDI